MKLPKRLLRPVSSMLALAACKTLGRLPLPLARRAGGVAAGVMYLVVPRLRRIGLDNLDQAYGDSLSAADKRQILRSAARNLGIVAAEFPHTVRMPRESLLRQVIVEGQEQLDDARGAVFISGHLANWEWVPAVATAFGTNIAVVVRRFDAPRLDRYVGGVRQAAGARTVGKDGAGQEVIQLLREGWIVGMLIDQAPTSSAVPARFFGRPCWATAAPVLAAMRARVPIHSVSMVRCADGRYRMTLSEPIPLVRTGDLRRDLVENTQRCQDAIEAMVREAPGQWLWFHRRWKRRPRFEAKWRADAALGAGRPPFPDGGSAGTCERAGTAR